jgi:prevent-host-death family protein
MIFCTEVWYFVQDIANSWGDMREREPMTQTMKASQARQEFSQLLNKVFRRETRVIVEKSGIPVAAIISAEDLERLIRLEAERQARFKVIDEIHARNWDKDPDEVERDVAQEIAAMRAEERQRQASRSTE